MPAAEMVLRLLDLIEAAGAPRDVAYFGFRFDEWVEQDAVRFGVMITDQWILTNGWSDRQRSISILNGSTSPDKARQ
jgi:hypothetical protein